ncbi:MAG TPA: SDR family NAD(P)-dependent oxidoreductase [Polyangiaceae bacterium]|nr:SDR family NAD(P)-dependent oxidoreductase [Polyangiaceae bacterium]
MTVRANPPREGVDGSLVADHDGQMGETDARRIPCGAGRQTRAVHQLQSIARIEPEKVASKLLDGIVVPIAGARAEVPLVEGPKEVQVAGPEGDVLDLHGGGPDVPDGPRPRHPYTASSGEGRDPLSGIRTGPTGVRPVRSEATHGAGPMSTEPKVVAIVGVGPGLGRALAVRFARGGLAVALVARQEQSLQPVQAEVTQGGGRVATYTADATDEASVRATFARIGLEIGAPEALVYNAGAFHVGGVLELSAQDFERAWRVNCLGGLLTAQAVLPRMLERGRGTILFSGATASLRGSARFAGLAVGKFGLRALAQSMARELGPKGIHVAHVVIDGGIDTPRVRAMAAGREQSLLAPAAIAETYWNLYAQDPSAWSHEIDLRPFAEKF